MATHAGVALSRDADAQAAARAAAEEALERAGGGRADWALVFATLPHRPHYAAMLASVQSVLGTATLAGCSGAGVIGAGSEVEADAGVAVLAVRSDRIQAEAHLLPAGDDRGRTAASEIGRSLRGDGGLLVALPDPFAVAPEAMLLALEEAVPGLPAVGAAAAAGPRVPTTFQFLGRNVATRSIAALHLRGALRSAIGVTQGCQPLGAPLVVTRSSENVILELDHKPALEALRGLLPAGLKESLERLGGHLFVGLPPDASLPAIAPGEYLVRPLLAIDPGRGALLVGHDVVEGRPLLFVLREPQAARDDLKQMLARLADAGAPDAWSFGLYFNCAGRGASLYGLTGIDSAFIAERFGDLPIIGFFGNSEIAPLRRHNRLFTYTGVLALCGEADAGRGAEPGRPAA